MSFLTMDGETQPPRACDRCHAIKERCEWMPDERQCDRCLRLQHVCETTRPKGRPGRKPGRRRKRLSTELGLSRIGSERLEETRVLRARPGRRRQSIGLIATIPKSISELSHVPTDEHQLVQRFFSQGNLLDTFSVGCSFREKVRQQVIPHMLLSKATFMDGLLVCAISWLEDVEDKANSNRLSTCYQYASSALATLAGLQVTDFQTMTDCLMLGAMVSTFAVKLRLNDILAITGRTLGLIEPVYTVSDPDRPEILVFMSCMVMWEIRGCLFSCAVPSLRFRPPTEPYADRHVGLCATLLPLLHDICKLSHTLIHAGNIDNMENREELHAVEQSVRQWQPVMPEDFTTRFDTVEVAHMLCQAQVMRLTALLVIHRLQHPFGVNDAPAQVMSATILSQLEMTLAATKQPVRCVDLALLVACLELKETERRKWFPDIPTFAGFSAEFGEHVQDALMSFWAAMDLFEIISWSELTLSGFAFLRNHCA
ncbi:hypothetical protein B0J13DRAFT_504623 [Dactylonectria estremocensis]|uniref:Zn(2)-C6 fungal-type domain-containing protein n=1 Tax=Dactylonectria estremocensis TaxID=1079267 RepID=A0A9P9J364_9HYPO|nr:hypothetical protein B0J13DRAFT_504623 [Dactylonectria estremocensis]